MNYKEYKPDEITFLPFVKAVLRDTSGNIKSVTLEIDGELYLIGEGRYMGISFGGREKESCYQVAGAVQSGAIQLPVDKSFTDKGDAENYVTELKELFEDVNVETVEVKV